MDKGGRYPGEKIGREASRKKTRMRKMRRKAYRQRLFYSGWNVKGTLTGDSFLKGKSCGKERKLNMTGKNRMGWGEELD